MKPAFYLRLALSFAALCTLFWVAAWRIFFAETVSSPFLSIALLSLLLILLRTRLSWAEVAEVIVLTLLLAALDLRFLGYRASWPVWPSFLGLASLYVMALRVIWFEGAERRLAVFTLIPSFLFVASEWCADYFLLWTEKASPKVYDLYLYSFDASLHVQIPFVVGRLFQRSFPFALISELFYIGLPIAIGLTFAGCLMRDRRNALPAFIAFLATGPVGAVFYSFFPALGPIHIFKTDFPWHPLTIQQVPHVFLEAVTAPGARNAMPSLHAAWIYLVFWYSRNLTLAERFVAALFVFFTLCATVGTGEHYFIDLIVAIPFFLFILGLTNLLVGQNRLRSFFLLAVGLGITALWLVLLRYALHAFWSSPVVPWFACALTVLVAALLLRPFWKSMPELEQGKVEIAPRLEAPGE